MSEAITRLDHKTRELLTSANPDTGFLIAARSTPAAVRDYRETILQAVEFIQSHGTPPLDRLGLGSTKAWLLIQRPDLKPGDPICYLKKFPGGRIGKLAGTLADIAVEERLNGLNAWAETSPLRRVSFPLGERTLHMMVTNPGAERVIKFIAQAPFIHEVATLPLPAITVENCLVQIRTDRWVNPETGDPRWLGLKLKGSTVQGVFPINRRILRCLEGMVALGQEYFSQPQVSQS